MWVWYCSWIEMFGGSLSISILLNCVKEKKKHARSSLVWHNNLFLYIVLFYSVLVFLEFTFGKWKCIVKGNQVLYHTFLGVIEQKPLFSIPTNFMMFCFIPWKKKEKKLTQFLKTSYSIRICFLEKKQWQIKL